MIPTESKARRLDEQVIRCVKKLPGLPESEGNQ